LWKPVEGTSHSERGDRLGSDNEVVADAPPRLEFESLDDQQASEIINSPQAEAIAPVMPTALIEPVELATPPTSGVGQPWGIAATGADSSKFTGKGITVAVLDTGIERGHPCFAGMDIREMDFTGSGHGDGRGHGTHCAGTIFGQEVGGIRYGVAPGIKKALVGKVLGKDGRGTTQMIFQGLAWAIAQHADIISMSLGLNFSGQVARRVADGWPVDLATSRALDDFRSTIRMFDSIVNVAHAGEAFGHVSLVIAATGNDSRREIDADYRIAAGTPAVACDISVAALKQDGAKLAVAEFSNSKPSIAAPGVDVVSAWLNGAFKSLNGTSMACPHVAGVAALWLESMRASGGVATRTALKSNLLARARSNVMIDGTGPVDVGSGLVTAP